MFAACATTQTRDFKDVPVNRVSSELSVVFINVV